MSESHAEQLDGSVPGEDDTDVIETGDLDDRIDGHIGRAPADYPPEEPMGVDDLGILSDGSIADDDYATRDSRHRHDDETPTDEDDEDDLAPGLIESGADPDLVDDEQQLIADDGDEDTSPEAAAVHLTDEAG
jgi:hypothetical protein